MAIAVSNRRVLVPAGILIALALGLSYYFFSKDTLAIYEYKLLDQDFRVRGAVDPGKDIVLIAVDRDSASALKRKAGAWKRSDFADTIRILTNAGADLIAIDYAFNIAGDPQEDEALRNAIQDSANVILATNISQNEGSVPFEPFRQQEVGEGFINIFPDEDGFVRRIAFSRAQDVAGSNIQLDFPFSIAIALSHLYPDGNYKVDLTHPNFAMLGKLHIPYSGKTATEGFLINYAGSAFHKISIKDVLGKQFPANDVAGKIVLIGNMDPLEHDYYPVPLAPEENIDETAHQSMRSMYGVEIHANAIRTLLLSAFLAPWPGWKNTVLFVLFSIALIWLAIGVRWNAFLATAISLLLIGALWIFCYRMFLAGTIVKAAPIYFAAILITLTGLAARQLQEALEKSRVTQMFGRYVSPGVVKELIKNKDLMQLSGRKQRLTIFFSDIRGFTSMSEKLQPEQVSALLNEYFSSMTRIVFKHGGTLDKFMGDAVMCFFGNPIYFEDHARRAVAMAVEMRAQMQELKKKWGSEGQEASFDIGMGLNTGDVVVGNLGSTEFFDYTVIGDNVNLACRLEAIAQRGQIIISESTYQEIKDLFKVRKLEPVTVKGKSLPVQIYEVLG